MGNFLSNPITEKNTHTGEGNGLVYGISDMQGWRGSMEDAYTIEASINGYSDYSFFAVYDGHGGALASKYASENMLEEICINLRKLTEAEMTPQKIGEAMKMAFLVIDEKLRRLPEVGRGEDHSGCTAIGAIITPTHIIVANTGDSRSVMGNSGKTVSMSFDHKPYNEIEKMRIENAGGTVRNKRVNGDLAVSRALGDFLYKNRHDLSPQQQQVSACPDIEIHQRNNSDEFLIIACDGIWDVMSNENSCDFVRQHFMRGEHDMGLVAEEMLDSCLNSGSRDNMSAIIVAFPGAKYGEGTGVKGIREERERMAREREETERSHQAMNTNTMGRFGSKD